MAPDSRLTQGRYGRFDARLDRGWKWRFLVGRPAVKYRYPEQTPKYYFPFLAARPWWDRDCPYLSQLEENWELVAADFERLKELARTHTYLPGRVEGQGWDSIRLYYGQFNQGLAQHCPETVRLLSTLPHCADSLGAVFFSVLRPGTTITSHCGPTNARLRYQLALEAPEGASLEVAGESRTWEAGRCLRFDDSFSHSARNPTPHSRAVLIVDLWHPELHPGEREALARGWGMWGR